MPIKTVIKKTLKGLFSGIYGKKQFQRFFEVLNEISLTGMNIGGGTNPKDSGERKVMEYVKSKIKQRPMIFDVGANIGEYSALLRSVFGEQATIHASEPSQKTFNHLVMNKSIIPHKIGFGGKNTKTILYTNADKSGLASLYNRNLEHFRIDMNREEAVDIKKIDTFCAENNIKKIHFLKLDIEGSELEAFKGASEMLKSSSIDFIQFEFGGCNVDSRTFFKDFYYLLRDDYNIYRIVQNGLHPILEYKDTYEVFTTTNYLAEKKYSDTT